VSRDFESEVVQELLDEGALNNRHSILVVCGTQFERNLFIAHGFADVIVTNLDHDLSAEVFLPFEWCVQDAQNLSFDDAQFDFAFVSNGLHHCRSPHRALLEMYRVSRRGIIAFESRDSLLINLATFLNLSEKYEKSAVDGKKGGVDNSDIPNYVYRWTEREFEKTIRSFDPTIEPMFRFFYMLRLPSNTNLHSR